jgi:twitching motility protein PilI
MSMRDPFQTLLTLEENCRLYAKTLPREKSLGRDWQGIGFMCNDKYFVAPLAEIKEVLTLPPATPFPLSVSWFRGIANLRGHFLPITDLQGFILQKSHHATALSRVLVVDFDKTGAGFLVQQVLGVQRFSSHLKENKEALTSVDLNQEFKPFVQGKFMEAGITWLLLSLKTLTETTQFYRIVKEGGV